MSGYRNIHREDLTCGDDDVVPVWNVRCSPLLLSSKKTASSPFKWRFWTACGDGAVRGYVVQEKSLAEATDTLDASACKVVHTHTLQLLASSESGSSSSSIGCSSVQIMRNYVGQDKNAGDLVVCGLTLNGRVNVWVLSETMDDDDDDEGTTKDTTTTITPTHSFMIQNTTATGTSLAICPPNMSHTISSTILLAVPCLDGTIAVVSSGVSVHNPKNNANDDNQNVEAAGTIVQTFSKTSTVPIAMSCAWHPHKYELAVGRKDGLVQVLNGVDGKKSHRMIQHEGPVRSIGFTPDGHLLCSASDDGMLCLWDVSRPVPTIVNHALLKNNNWVFQMTPLWDSRRFVSTTSTKLQVWTCESDMDSNGEVHSFAIDRDTSVPPQQSIWMTADAIFSEHKSQAAAAPTPVPRMVSITETGRLQIYSLEA